jgi:hypothetical protein
MKRALRFISLTGLAFLLFSCPMAQVGVSPDSATSPGASRPEMQPSIMTDSARTQAVYIDEKGARIDITAQEPDGSVVRATQAIGLALMADAGSSARAAAGDGDQLRALVIGTRSDGAPGVWAILRNGTVLPAAEDSAGKSTSALPQCDDRDHGLRGWFGWKYYVTGISDDGLMIVGYAKNEKGFHLGVVKIEPGTTVGVYWRVKKISHRPHVRIEPARVIGTLDTTPFPKKNGHRSRWIDALRLSRLPGIQLFFLKYFTSYLIMADAVSRDAAKDLYVVTGTDQDGDDATATIDRLNRIVITPAPPAGQPDLKITAIQVPSTPQTIAATWTLAATVANGGTADAGPSTLLYQVSTSSVLDSSATAIGTRPVPALAAGASYTDTWSTTFSIPQSGTHWIYVTTDSGGVVAESNEANNTSSASVPIIYGLIVIDTYLPKSGAPSSVDTFVSLFSSSGDTTVETPNIWKDDLPPYTTEKGAIIEKGSAGDYGRITYSGGLAPGTYYIRVRGVQSTQNGPYGIRVLNVAADNPTGPGWPWYFLTTNTADANPLGGSYESDDSPLQGGVPPNAVPITLGGKLNRWLTAGNITAAPPVPGDVDWFKLTLP